MNESPSLGPILLAGGAEFDGRMASADRVWLKMLGNPNPAVAVIPTANADKPRQAAQSGVRHFKGLFTRSVAVMIEDEAGATDPANVATLAGCDAFYFTGGDPNRVVAAFAGSAAWETIVRRWREGAALGGSSAGAMVFAANILAWERWEAGLGLIPGLAVRPHFDRNEPGAVDRSQAAIAERGLVGLGIDESTAAIWHRGTWQVSGRGRVVVLTPEGVREYREGDVIEGLPQPV